MSFANLVLSLERCLGLLGLGVLLLRLGLRDRDRLNLSSLGRALRDLDRSDDDDEDDDDELERLEVYLPAAKPVQIQVFLWKINKVRQEEFFLIPHFSSPGWSRVCVSRVRVQVNITHRNGFSFVTCFLIFGFLYFYVDL